MNNKSIISSREDKQSDELSEDIEIVGPGQMLSEARKNLSLTTEDVAKKLKFKTSLVENIEQDLFNQKLPATYNRGYLCSYAKLVNVDAKEVLNAYDMLGVAEVQRSEMQSFSNLTEKQAEHSRLMWFSYFIVAILCGLMVLWWQQEPKQSVDEKISSELTTPVLSTPSVSVENEENKSEELSPDNNLPSTETIKEQAASEQIEPLTSPEQASQNNGNLTAVEPLAEILEEEITNTLSNEDEQPIANVSTAVFTFSGDCWVNIFDATGERIAWGVKKSGYVMTISGAAPLKITLGKPELASIVFDGEPVDMSMFSKGNIAKFTLPLNL
ncbi:RodZ domain-containing protein [Colwellia sp. E150_009]|jgi:cytoskeleton protein RodZ